MIVKILEIAPATSGTVYRWVGGFNGWKVEGEVTRITGKKDFAVGDMGWMDSPSSESIHIPFSWP